MEKMVQEPTLGLNHPLVAMCHGRITSALEPKFSNLSNGENNAS